MIVRARQGRLALWRREVSPAQRARQGNTPSNIDPTGSPLPASADRLRQTARRRLLAIVRTRHENVTRHFAFRRPQAAPATAYNLGSRINKKGTALDVSVLTTCCDTLWVSKWASLNLVTWTSRKPRVRHEQLDGASGGMIGKHGTMMSDHTIAAILFMVGALVLVARAVLWRLLTFSARVLPPLWARATAPPARPHAFLRLWPTASHPGFRALLTSRLNPASFRGLPLTPALPRSNTPRHSWAA